MGFDGDTGRGAHEGETGLPPGLSTAGMDSGEGPDGDRSSCSTGRLCPFLDGDLPWADSGGDRWGGEDAACGCGLPITGTMGGPGGTAAY